MFYTIGFVNRRSGVQASEAAPNNSAHVREVTSAATWPTVAYDAGHAEVPDPSTVPMATKWAPLPPRRLGATLYWPRLR
jgi:hypothetical protein